MASWAKRLTSLATVLALSGSPAVLSACMALCLQGVPAEAMGHEDGASVGHAVHASAPTPTVSSGHAHHGSPASPSSAASADDSVSLDPSDARLIATCNNCCPGGQVAFVAGPGLGPTDAYALGAAPITSRLASFFLTTSVLAAWPPSPPVPPPSPTRAPLVLRV